MMILGGGNDILKNLISDTGRASLLWLSSPKYIARLIFLGQS